MFSLLYVVFEFVATAVGTLMKFAMLITLMMGAIGTDPAPTVLAQVVIGTHADATSWNAHHYFPFVDAFI